MYLITLKVVLTNICADHQVNEGESNTPCPGTLEVTCSSGSGLEITKSTKGSQIHLALAHWKWHAPRAGLEITKSMKGSQIHLALAHWKWHAPRVEKFAKALDWDANLHNWETKTLKLDKWTFLTKKWPNIIV
jgi:hypothetical protein